MDSPASAEDTNYQVCGVILQFQQSSSKPYVRQNTVGYMKYTKLPNYDFESSVRWPQRGSYVLQPRLRQIVTINDEDNALRMSKSLRSELGVQVLPQNAGKTSKRKICTISEIDNKYCAPSKERLSNNKNMKSSTVKSARPIGISSRSNYQPPGSPPNTPFKYLRRRETKPCAKSDALNINRNLNKPNTRKPRNPATQVEAKTKAESFSENKEYKLQTKSLLTNQQVLNSARLANRTKNYENKKSMQSMGKNDELENNNIKKQATVKKIQGIGRNFNLSTITPRAIAKDSNIKENESNIPSNQHVSFQKGNHVVIYVPESKKKERTPAKKQAPIPSPKATQEKSTETKSTIEAGIVAVNTTSDMNIGTDPEPEKVHVHTEIDNLNNDNTIQTDDIRESFFENLEIPNYTLLKDKSIESKNEVISIYKASSLPNLQVPSINFNSVHDDKKLTMEDDKSKSYIIGCATLTYTTRQKIDFRLVSNKELPKSSDRSSPLLYPMNVVSVFQTELKKNEASESLSQKDAQKKKHKQNSNQKKDIHPLDCSFEAGSSKLVKPSELINTISVNNSLLQNHDICEQFRRELNFIDSFFESLQYLENCSLSNNTNVENWVSKSGLNLTNPEYEALLSNFENGANTDDTETMASKSLCLLNLLIRDEQRRAKNLLFVLKMREDALKDFTKSQILWLENKKKNDNIDVPSLKKKQRGALLKLQHECGEMQRMRKALLALSEKRKLALLKTKKNIELKLKSNISADQILLNKKKLKRSSSSDRLTVPLKCFDLSSSGCEESSASKVKSEPNFEVLPKQLHYTGSVEKSIQTGDSLLIKTDEATSTASENHVTVDGGYLNIIFNNLNLPEIFSSGKQYEVNEEALKSIVNSANNRSAVVQSDIGEKLIDLIKSNTREQDSSSSPSTARSLVEEFDQIYKDLTGDDKFQLLDSNWRLDADLDPRNVVFNDSGAPNDNETRVESVNKFRENLKSVPVVEDRTKVENEVGTVKETSPYRGEEPDAEPAVTSKLEPVVDSDSLCELAVGKEAETPRLESEADMQAPTEPSLEAGPLPVPPGAAASTEVLVHSTPKTESTLNPESSSLEAIIQPLVSPSHNEAEELRRQQLAIEREIKALEQQQSQLLVVREIPDKPPPPYTPPTENRISIPPRMFLADDTLEHKVEKALFGDIIIETSNPDAFDVFFQDFCNESVQKYKSDVSDKPWDACNLLPQKPPLTKEKLTQRTVADMKEVLATGGAPFVVSSVGSRRADHIDDILFSEWRRCEPEWTALHSDEVKVKSQVFEGIFQRLLNKTIDEYKRTVLHNEDNVTSD